ncbi:GAF and ANTAR domain-containing protein [Longispora sp. NPDC051575]|uniref:GAF and ANTAR domain-containing protein n=1 Tax=Longispora sp. NPDC051575 TaxID=3154943 RepID=UPI003413FF26
MTGGRAARIRVRIARQAGAEVVSVAHVCAAAVAGVGVDGAGMTVGRSTVHATDPVAAALEEWQLVYGEGPCVDAWATGGPVLVVDLGATAARWPVFTPAALDSGARAVFALPLQVGAIRLGVLDLYRAGPGPLSPGQLADALAYADAAGTLLLDGARAGAPDPTAHDAQVHQATGMVLAQLGVSAEVAFARLRAHAYAQDRLLRDVARDVVGRRLRFEPEPSPEDQNER